MKINLRKMCVAFNHNRWFGRSCSNILRGLNVEHFVCDDKYKCKNVNVDIEDVLKIMVEGRTREEFLFNYIKYGDRE
jgi:hypothetical protein